MISLSWMDSSTPDELGRTPSTFGRGLAFSVSSVVSSFLTFVLPTTSLGGCSVRSLLSATATLLSAVGIPPVGMVSSAMIKGWPSVSSRSIDVSPSSFVHALCCSSFSIGCVLSPSAIVVCCSIMTTFPPSIDG